MKYYLFCKTQKDIEWLKSEYSRIETQINKGITPVYSELRSAKTRLVETLPFGLIQATFLIIGTFLLSKLHLSELWNVAIVLLVNSIVQALTEVVFVIGKDKLRRKLLKRMNIEYSEKSVAILESMEYQSV